MFWKKKPSSAPPHKQAGKGESSPATPRAGGDEFERALDTLAGVVRAIGRFAMDTPETSAHQVHERAEHWSQHLLIRRPKPGDDERSGKQERDYRALLEFVTDQRRQESTHVHKALSDLRQTVWAFIRSLSSALAEDAKNDAIVTAQLANLTNAAQHGSLEELRRAAVTVAGSISDALQRRKSEQQQRNGQLGQRLLALGRGLEEPRTQDGLDALTLLNSRRTFEEYAGQLVELRPFVDQPTSLVLVELDAFAALCERHGAAAGDDALRMFSRCLVRTFLRKDDFLARFEEHRFAVIFPDTDLKHALVLADRLPPALRRLDVPERPELAVTVTYGASALEPSDTVESWAQRAERALEHARQARAAARSVPV